MKKILLTLSVVLGFGFAAMAQQEPLKAKLNKKDVSSKKAEKAKIQQQKMESDKPSQQTAKHSSTASAANADRASNATKNK